MKFIIICLFAFVATAASKIAVERYDCISFQMNAAAEKSPKYAAFYTKASEVFTILLKTKKCDAINDHSTKLRCHQELNALNTKFDEELSQLIDTPNVSCIEEKFFVQNFDWKLSNFWQLLGPEYEEMWSTIEEIIDKCMDLYKRGFGRKMRKITSIFKSF